MAQVRPSCLLLLDIDESLATEETKLEVGRCWTYVGTALVRPHASTDPQYNVMRLLPKLGTRKYVHSEDEGADELWSEVMEQWFHNQFHTISNHMRIYNRRQREEGNAELPFERMDVELENGELTVRLALDSTYRIAADKSSLLTQARTALNEGKLGDGVKAVSMPSSSEYAKQKVAGEAAAAERRALEEQQKAEEEAKAAAEAAAAEAEIAAEFLENPEVADAERLEQQKAEEEMRRKMEEMYGDEEADFEIDYHIWGIEYADGSTAIYNSETGELSAKEA